MDSTFLFILPKESRLRLNCSRGELVDSSVIVFGFVFNPLRSVFIVVAWVQEGRSSGPSCTIVKESLLYLKGIPKMSATLNVKKHARERRGRKTRN